MAHQLQALEPAPAQTYASLAALAAELEHVGTYPHLPLRHRPRTERSTQHGAHQRAIEIPKTSSMESGERVSGAGKRLSSVAPRGGVGCSALLGGTTAILLCSRPAPHPTAIQRQ